MGTKTFNNYEDLLTFTRASKGHALRPVSYGSELVTNGDFSTDSDWTKSAGSTIANGVLTHTVVSGGYQSTRQLYEFEAGSIYVLTATVNGTSGKNMRFRDDAQNEGGLRYDTSDGATNGKVIMNGSDQNVRFVFQARGGSDRILIERDSTSGDFSYTVDNVSLKKVTFDESDGTLTLFEHPNNIPRVEYDADGNRLGLLVEEARTNLVTYSEDLSPLTKVNSPTITTDIATAPDGTETVDGIQDASGGAFRRVKMFQGSVTANSTHTGSLFVKKETSETNYGGVTLNFTGGTSKVCYGIIDAVNGTINAPSIGNTITATFTTTEVGDFWRFSITATDTGSNTQLEFGVYGTLSTNGTTVGSGAGSVRRIWGAQLEAGAFPTSYIKNEGTSGGVTRSADVASIPVADFGYNQSEGTVFVEIADKNGGVLSALGDGTFTNDLRFGVAGSNVARGTGSGFTNLVQAGGYADGIKIAVRIDEDNYQSSEDGNISSIDTSASLPPNPESILIGRDYGAYINGHIKSIRYYPRGLTATQLQEITS